MKYDFNGTLLCDRCTPIDKFIPARSGGTVVTPKPPTRPIFPVLEHPFGYGARPHRRFVMSFASRVRLTVMRLFRQGRTLVVDRRGVTALEYGLIAALLALTVVGGAKTFGTNVASLFTNLGTSVSGISTSMPK
jgi:pilus assembly protein Flp/PilA